MMWTITVSIDSMEWKYIEPSVVVSFEDESLH